MEAEGCEARIKNCPRKPVPHPGPAPSLDASPWPALRSLPLEVVVFLADQSHGAPSVPPRGLELPPRGWSVSLHSGDSWQDLLGCDFVLDLIGQTEDLGDPVSPHSYPIAPRGL